MLAAAAVLSLHQPVCRISAILFIGIKTTQHLFGHQHFAADTAGKGSRAGRGGIAFQFKYDSLHLFNIRSNIVSDFAVAPCYCPNESPLFVLQLHTGAVQFILYQKIGERHLFRPFLETFGIRCFFLTPHRDNVFRFREAVGAVLGYRCK